ncbi:MAG: Acetyl-coenzyme A carboxyl transferase alpha chain / Acetyl-coenzyme A carboxyl transferase beta chain; Propionyl-CoA carboxylase beta chain, partial [uncultured Solirubrobacterales bacterium]
ARQGPGNIRGEARPARGAAPCRRALRLRAGGREAARQGQADRARAGREAARPRLVPGARHLRAPSHIRVRDGEEQALGRRGGHRSRDHRRAPGVRLLAGLHGLRRLARRGHGREDVQGHGPGGQDRLSGDRDKRLGRGADPGGRGLARGLRRRVRAERPVLGRYPADLADHGPVRGGRGLLAGHDRLHLHGEGDLAHVHHRSRRDQDRDRRGGRVRGAR